MSGIRKSKKPSPALPANIEVKSIGLNFSFKHIDLVGNEDFSLDHGGDGYTKSLLERLRDISGMELGEFLKSRSLRTHPIEWPKTSQPNGFTHLNPQLRDILAWQFQVSSNEHGRVHGFLIDETFFVVWLDPAHKLYPTQK